MWFACSARKASSQRKRGTAQQASHLGGLPKGYFFNSISPGEELIPNPIEPLAHDQGVGIDADEVAVHVEHLLFVNLEQLIPKASSDPSHISSGLQSTRMKKCMSPRSDK
jgi:hypothetical protein